MIMNIIYFIFIIITATRELPKFQQKQQKNFMHYAFYFIFYKRLAIQRYLDFRSS